MRILRHLALSLSFVVLALGAPAWAVFGPDFAKEAADEQLAVSIAMDAQANGYKLISAEQLKKLLDEKKDMLVVDTMPMADSYEKGHVPGAKQFLFPVKPMAEWDAAQADGKTQADFQALLGDKKDRMLVFYCGYLKCSRSQNGAVWARKLGYTNVYRQPGGIFAWRGLNYEMATGK